MDKEQFMEMLRSLGVGGGGAQPPAQLPPTQTGAAPSSGMFIPDGQVDDKFNPTNKGASLFQNRSGSDSLFQALMQQRGGM